MDTENNNSNNNNTVIGKEPPPPSHTKKSPFRPGANVPGVAVDALRAHGSAGLLPRRAAEHGERDPLARRVEPAGAHRAPHGERRVVAGRARREDVGTGAAGVCQVGLAAGASSSSGSGSSSRIAAGRSKHCSATAGGAAVAAGTDEKTHGVVKPSATPHAAHRALIRAEVLVAGPARGGHAVCVWQFF
jgi:hypothetical protein